MHSSIARNNSAASSPSGITQPPDSEATQRLKTNPKHAPAYKHQQSQRRNPHIPLGAAVRGHPRHETVAQGLDTLLKLGNTVGRPVRSVDSGNRFVAGKGKVQHVGGAVPTITRHALPVAFGGQGDGGLADHGAGTVVAIGITPDTVHQLVATHHGDDAQGTDAVLGRAEGVPPAAAGVSKHHIRMHVGIEVANAVRLYGVSEGRLALVIAAAGGAAAAVVGGASQSAIAIYVDVGKGAALTLDIYDPVVVEVVPAVAKVWDKSVVVKVRAWSRGEEDELPGPRSVA